MKKLCGLQRFKMMQAVPWLSTVNSGTFHVPSSCIQAPGEADVSRDGWMDGWTISNPTFHASHMSQFALVAQNIKKLPAF